MAATVVWLALACSPSTGTAARPPQPASSVAPPAAASSAAAVGPADRCHTSQLAATRVGNAGVATGNVYQQFALTNRSGDSCWLYGYVGLLLEDSGARPLPTQVERGFAPRLSPRQFTLPPGVGAPFWLHWSDIPSGAAACPEAAILLVTPPNETAQLTVDGISITACRGMIEESPVMPPGTVYR